MDEVIDINSFLEKRKNDPGVNVKKLKPGTKIKVRTIYSTYDFEVVNYGGNLIAKGGKYIPEQREVRLTGSTYGGSMLKIGWIGRDMNMEIWLGHKMLTTSRVKHVTIIGDGWDYSLWESDD